MYIYIYIGLSLDTLDNLWIISGHFLSQVPQKLSTEGRKNLITCLRFNQCTLFLNQCLPFIQMSTAITGLSSDKNTPQIRFVLKGPTATSIHYVN